MARSLPKALKTGRPRSAQTYLALILHAHLPYVRHPEQSHFLEETWLFEAITESYLPLIEAFERLAKDGIPFRVTMSVSPTLASMWADPLLQARYVEHTDRLMELAEREEGRAAPGSPPRRLGRYYADLLRHRRAQYEALSGDLVGAVRRLVRQGHLELMTTAATHAFLPLLGHSEAVYAQVTYGIETCRRLFHSAPKGFWFPECGFEPGAAAVTAAQGIIYTVVDSHAVLHARPRPAAAVYAPIACRDTGLVAFGRDPVSSGQVWDASFGYPGDPLYRDFYRDIGFDRDLGHLAPWLQGPEGSIRSFTGLKYYRVSEPGEPKGWYDPRRAHRRAEEHARHFLHARKRQGDRLYRAMGQAPILTVPFDAELFGHWWFEGPIWLEALFRENAAQAARERVTFTTPSAHLAEWGYPSAAAIPMSSWGNRGYSSVWLNRRNDWLPMQVDRAVRAMKELAASHRRPTGMIRRALNQAGRELLLAQGSDWAFILNAGSATGYAERRAKEHLRRFSALHEQIRSGTIDLAALQAWEWQHPVFPDLDYRVFAGERAADDRWAAAGQRTTRGHRAAASQGTTTGHRTAAGQRAGAGSISSTSISVG